MKIILTGGGTLGSVIPILAVAQELKRQRPETEFLWIGTKDGSEKSLVESYNIPFQAISSGKLRRYFSLKNFLDPFRVIVGFFQSIGIIRKFKPDLVLAAGGFVGVPVIWAAWLLGVKSIAHQQDIGPGLANKLVSPVVKKITVTFEESKNYFPRSKTVLIGNPVRPEIFDGDREQARQFFHLEEGLPTILFLGGGTGSLTLNKIIIQSLKNILEFFQVIHVTGRGKGLEGIKSEVKSQAEFKKIVAEESSSLINSRYHSYEFIIEEMKDAYIVADLIISRAGLSTLSELAVLGKPTILIPLPGHQEDNAAYFRRNNAAVVLSQKDLISEDLVGVIKTLINNKTELETLGRNIKKIMPPDAAEKMAKVILDVLKE
jgi:UDP-N-acetylglucosamine--N-acetylmuramyl-(pentapeptide) pyrophosphoryl-undecaprenol N-acetylglucosamine transferase